jgi:hypothetical protein
MPRYTDSDILKNFEKIMSEKGAISKKAEKKSTHETRSPKEINDLYHVKPDTAKGMDYDRHIGQLAHKDMAVVLPAHDKLNGLVETDQERQNIMINLVLKPTHGHLGAKKYAESQLMGSLIRVAQDLDNQDIEELRVLADTCIDQLQKKAFEKEALAPLAIVGIVAAVAAAGGLLYWQQHHDAASMGFRQDSLTMISELKDLANAGGWGRDELKSEFKSEINNAISELSALNTEYGALEGVIEDIESMKTGSQLKTVLDTAKMLQSKPNYQAVYEKFKAMAKNVEPMLTKLETNFKNEAYKKRQVKDKGIWSEINDMVGGALHGGKGLIKDDFDDVVRTLPAYRASITEVLELIAGAESAEKKAVDDVKASQANSKAYDSKQFGNKTQPSSATAEADSELAQLQRQLAPFQFKV